MAVSEPKPGDVKVVDGVNLYFNGFNWLTEKNTFRLVVQAHLRRVMAELIEEYDEDSPETFDRFITDIVCEEVFDFLLEDWD